VARILLLQLNLLEISTLGYRFDVFKKIYSKMLTCAIAPMTYVKASHNAPPRRLLITKEKMTALRAVIALGKADKGARENLHMLSGKNNCVLRRIGANASGEVEKVTGES
jgi:hypothetical protein